MAEALPQAPDISASPAPSFRLVETRPDEILRHNISDEELGGLVDLKRDHLWECMWVAFGVAGGAAPATLTALCASYLKSPPIPFEIGDLVQFTLCIGGLLTGVVLAIATHNKGKDAKTLVKEIRERTRHSVSR